MVGIWRGGVIVRTTLVNISKTINERTYLTRTRKGFDSNKICGRKQLKYQESPNTEEVTILNLLYNEHQVNYNGGAVDGSDGQVDAMFVTLVESVLLQMYQNSAFMQGQFDVYKEEEMTVATGP